MKCRTLCGCIALLLPFGAAVGQEAPNFSGTWDARSDSSSKLVLDQKTDAIHVKEIKGTETTADYTCNTLGKDCEVKTEGHPAKVSFWFNGPKLVQFETHGSNVIRRRFEIAEGGKALNVEVSHISPEGKDEKLVFAREKP